MHSVTSRLRTAVLLTVLSIAFPSVLAGQSEAAVRWSGLGPEGAEAADLAASSAAPGLVWAAVELGGVFKSTDSGATWRPARGGLETLTAHSIAADPEDPMKAFVATNEGLFVTTDGGASWERRELPGPKPVQANQVREVAVAPSDPDRVYLATTEALWRSTDGGATFVKRGAPLPAGGPRALAVRPDDPETVFFSVWHAGIFVSSDGGATRAQLADGIDLTGFDATAEVIVFSPSDPDTVYAGVDQAGNLIGVFKSVDGGASWSHVGKRLTGEVGWKAPVALAIDPADPDAVVTGGPWGLFRSTDGGATWERAPIPDTPLGPRSVLSAAWLPGAGGTVLAGTRDGGVLRSTDGGAGWSPSNGGLDSRPLGIRSSSPDPGGVDREHPGLVVDPRGNGRLYTVSRDFRLYASEDWGSSWRRIDATFDPTGEGPGRGVVVGFRLHPAHPDTLFARVYFRPTPQEPMLEALVRSRDAGRTWTRVGEGLPRIGLDPYRTHGDLHWDPQASGHAAGALYLQLGDTVYRSRDDGATWKVWLDDLPSPAEGQVHLSSLAPAPNGNPLFGWADVTGDDGCTIGFCPPDPIVRRLFKSTDGGRTWSELTAANDALAAGEPRFVDDANPSVWYATIGGDLFRSTDGGASFSFYARTPYEPLGSRPRDGWPAEEIADPAEPGVRYRVRSGEAVERSADGGETWHEFASGLVPYQASGLVLVPFEGAGSRVLFAVTDAGAWARPLDGGAFPPPTGDAITDPDFPDFRFHFEIEAAGETLPGRVEEAGCLPETLCVSGALPGRIEVLARIVGPKPNGFLWPTLVKLTTSEVRVEIEQISTGIRKSYTLEGARPGFDELPGLFDRHGFSPQ